MDIRRVRGSAPASNATDRSVDLSVAVRSTVGVVGLLQQQLGRNLRRLRMERRLSQEAFAEMLNVHRTYVGGLERGERNPSLRVIERLAEELDVEPLELLQDGDGAVAPLLRAAADGDVSDTPDVRSLPTVGRPRPR